MARGAASTKWRKRAFTRLREAGHQAGGARRQVIDLLASEPCAMTALDMDRRLPAGRASIYRALEQLERLHLVQRIDVGGDAAGYERLDPDQHHHHVVCENCGRIEPFADEALEREIEAVGSRSGFQVASHDVVLRGRCPDCRPGRA